MAELHTHPSPPYIFCICLSVDGDLGFPVFIVNTMNSEQWGYIYLFKLVFLFSSDKYLGVELLGHSSLFLICKGTAILFSSGCTSLHSHQQYSGAPLSLYPCQPTLVFSCLFNTSHSNRYQWYLIVFLICISLLVNERLPWWLLGTFSWSYWPSVLWKTIFLDYMSIKKVRLFYCY